MLPGHMWQDVLHNEMHDAFDTFEGQAAGRKCPPAQVTEGQDKHGRH